MALRDACRLVLRGIAALGIYLPLVLLGSLIAAGCADEDAGGVIGAIQTTRATQQPEATAPPQETGEVLPTATEDAAAPPTETPPEPEESAPTSTEEPAAPPTEAPPAQVEPPDQPAVEPEGDAGVVGEDDGGLPWGWIAFGAVAVLAAFLLLGWLRDRRRARRSQAAGWKEKALDVYARAAALHDALGVALAPGPAPEGSADAVRSSWQDIERRLNDLAVDLHALEVSPPDASTAEALRELQAALGTLRSAAQSDVGVRTQGAPAANQVEESAALVRRRLSEFDGALTAFKAMI